MSERGESNLAIEKGRDAAERLIEKHFVIDDSGLDRVWQEEILADGKARIQPENLEERRQKKYQQFKADIFVPREQVQTNNLWNLFNPETVAALNGLFQELRDIQQSEDGEEGEMRATIKRHFYWDKPLYFLLREGLMQAIVNKVGVQKTEEYLKVQTILMDPKQRVTSEQREGFERYLREVYIAMYEMGLDPAEVDG